MIAAGPVQFTTVLLSIVAGPNGAPTPILCDQSRGVLLVEPLYGPPTVDMEINDALPMETQRLTELAWASRRISASAE